MGHINPIRYRGYYYDEETGLYYLQSRYYDPTVGRFLNADGYITTGQGLLSYNMFAYCNNNPVYYKDANGDFASAAAGAAAGIGAALAGIPVIGWVALGVIALAAAITAGVLTAQAVQASSFPKVSSTPKTEEKEKDATLPSRPKKQAIFTINPYDFKPERLVMKEYSGSYNGKIIEWRDPISNSKIFEWNEDLKYGAHYHALLIEWDGTHDGTHYAPGSLVPEPWNSMYFGGQL